MGGSRVLPLAKAFVAHVSKAVRLFSCGLPQPENGAYLSPFSSLPTPVIDHDLQYDRYSEAVRQLRPLFPPTCTFLEPDDVAVVGDVPIGAGSFADIWEGTANGRRILLKSYRRHEYCDIERLFRRYLGEAWVYTQLSHPNVIRCVGVSPTPSHPLSLVLDAAGHLNLKEYLHRNPGVNRLELVLGIARGLNHMHDRGIPHGHLTANIFVDPDGTPRIAGFGSSFMLSCQDSWSESGAVGFHRGSAPELVRPRKPGKPANRITKASDMYAFGMLTWEIFSGQAPFTGDLDATVVRRVLKGDRPSRPNHDGLSDKVWKMVKACWHDIPSCRMTVEEVVALIEAKKSHPHPGT